jgi:molecular chaperone DnaJ
MAGKDYYKILGVPRTATDKDIKKAYRLLARKYHPDVNPGDKSAESRFKEINEANEVLSDPAKKQKYDRFGDQWENADQFTSRAGQGPGPQWGQARPGGGTTYTRSFDFDNLGDLGSIFDNLYQGFGQSGPAQQQTATRPRDIEHSIEVTLEEAFNGTRRMLQLDAEEICPSCGGMGKLQGQRGVRPCPSCSGSGRIVKPKRLEVKIPAGVTEGSKIRLAREGGIGRGGDRGDLYLVIKLLPHKAFDRKGDDLYTDASVPLTTALLGGEITVQTLKDKLALKIPPETQNGNLFRLTGKGMPHLNGAGSGDLYARTKVILPSKLTPQEKQLFEQFQKLRPNG